MILIANKKPGMTADEFEVRHAEQLSPAQEKLLLAADKRYGKLSPCGEAAHFVSVSQGQASTAKALERMGLGGYTGGEAGNGGAKFWIYDAGHAVAQSIRVTP